MRTLRIFLALTLILALLLVKSHLDSISSERGQSPDDARDIASKSVLNEGGTSIELVSKGHPLEESSLTIELPSNPEAYPQPTNPSAPERWEPESIPVNVPEQLALDAHGDSTAAMEEYWRQLDAERKSKTKTSRPKVKPKSDRIIVIGRTSGEYTSWLEDELPEWQHAVYIVDDSEAELHVQANKGKESNIYLQYILDHYYSLPDYIVFLHAHRISPHVEFYEQDNVLTVRRLQLDYLRKAGYVNLRCQWGPGCPDELQPYRQLDGHTAEIAFTGAWVQMFNNTDVPAVVATPCCAQFAVTRQQVLARPLSDYETYHRWLMETELDDETSGRVFEYLWHVIFGQDPVFCPSKIQCYNDVYGAEYNPEYDVSFFADGSWVGINSFEN